MEEDGPLITLFGLILLLLPAGIMALGVTQPHLTPWASYSAAGVLLLMAADHLLARRTAVFTASRHTPDKLSVGAENRVTISVRSRTRFLLRMLVKDDPPARFRTPQRLQRLVVAPFTTQQVSYRTMPPARGDYSFGNLHFRGLSFLGLTYWQRTIAAGREVAVYPNLAEVARYEELARAGRLTQAGYHPYRRLGMGTEFESLRDYVPDDEFRHIDWKATARRHKPTTRQYETERSQSLMIMIDSGRMMAGTASLPAKAAEGGREPTRTAAMSKLDYAINAALMLAYVATERDDRVGLLAFADAVQQFVPPSKGKAQVGRIAEALYGLEARLHEPDYGLAFSTLFSRSRKRSLVICFTDLIDKDASARLLSGMASLFPRHLPLLVAIQDPDLQAAAAQDPAGAFEAYEKAVAIAAIGDRREALSAITRRGVLVLDTTPQALTVAAVNRYLEIKDRHAL